MFLRELVSNAADACDKKRFLSITTAGDDSEDGKNLAKPTIRIRSNKEDMTVTIEDSGVGMTKSELQNNLGRIAQSGTKKFLEALGENSGSGSSSSADVNLIGQFGVGFYSAYLVADKVEVVTKSMQPNSVQLRWTSDASSKYTIAEDTDSDNIIEGSGTRLILHLKDDALEYLEPAKLEDLLQHYSEFVEFPISVWKEKTEYKRVPDDEANEDLPEGEEPKMKTVPETTEGYEQMNTNKPIWLRSPSDVTEEEYKDFYQSAFRHRTMNLWRIHTFHSRDKSNASPYCTFLECCPLNYRVICSMMTRGTFVSTSNGSSSTTSSRILSPGGSSLFGVSSTRRICRSMSPERYCKSPRY